MPFCPFPAKIASSSWTGGSPKLCQPCHELCQSNDKSARFDTQRSEDRRRPNRRSLLPAPCSRPAPCSLLQLPGRPGRLPAQGSHRSGRARTRASGSSSNPFASPRPSAVTNPYCTIRRHCGHTSRKFDAFQVLPADGRVTRCLASHPPGPCGSSSPASAVLSRHCDFLPPLPPRFVAFAWRYHGTTHLSLPTPLRAAASGLGLFARYPRPGCFRGDGRISQVPGEPRFPFAHVLRPRPAPAHLTTCGTLGVAPALRTTKAPTIRTISRLNSMAFGLAVYASRCRLPFLAQDSLPGAGQALLGGLLPARSLYKVSNHVMRFSSSSKLLGATWVHPGLQETLFSP